MIFLDKMPFKVLGTSGSFAPNSFEIIKCIVPVDSGATIKAVSKNGDHHTSDGSLSAAGISRLPGEMVYGEFTSAQVTTGKALVYYTNIAERL